MVIWLDNNNMIIKANIYTTKIKTNDLLKLLHNTNATELLLQIQFFALKFCIIQMQLYNCYKYNFAFLIYCIFCVNEMSCPVC